MIRRHVDSVNRFTEAHLPEIGACLTLCYSWGFAMPLSRTQAVLSGILTAAEVLWLTVVAWRSYRDMDQAPLFFTTIGHAMNYITGIEGMMPVGTVTVDADAFFVIPGTRDIYAYNVRLRAEEFVTEEHVPMLVDLARAGDESTFRDLARTLGVKAEHLDALWAGTVARVARRQKDKTEVTA